MTKLHQVVTRYKTLQSQNEALKEENKDPRIEQLEKEKNNLVEKMKEMIGKCRHLQTQLAAVEENTDVKKEEKTPVDDKEKKSCHDENDKKQEAWDKEREELMNKLQQVASRYKTLQSQSVQLQQQLKESTSSSPPLSDIEPSLLLELQEALQLKSERVGTLENDIKIIKNQYEKTVLEKDGTQAAFEDAVAKYRMEATHSQEQVQVQQARIGKLESILQEKEGLVQQWQTSDSLVTELKVQLQASKAQVETLTVEYGAVHEALQEMDREKKQEKEQAAEILQHLQLEKSTY